MRPGPYAADLGHRVEFHPSIDSTNTRALALARDFGERGPVWVVAGEQKAGRGRLSRTWASPPGNLYASLLLIDPCPPHRAPELGFVAGVALIAAARARVGDVSGLGLKWPNDLICDGAKLSGMLLEATRLPSGALAAVVGIGVNCRSHPTNLAYEATDLETIRAGAGDPERLFMALSDEMARALALWGGGEGFAAIRQRWLTSAHGLGAPIRVALAERNVEGVFDTIDPHGRLVVLTPQGSVSIDAGDVLLGPR